MIFPPSKDADLLAWSDNFDEKISASAVTYGLTPAQAAASNVLHVDFRNKYALAINENTNSKTNIGNKNSAKQELLYGAGGAWELVNIIQANPAMMRLPITGNRGFAYAEVTAGGVPLSEVRLETMESRICPGLFLCGEICDVDGRIGGYNFQWAWASGFIAGTSAATVHPAKLEREMQQCPVKDSSLKSAE